MKITLKKIKHSTFASHETNNFVADLYVDGKPFAIVSNDGQGGCDMHFKHEKNLQSSAEFNDELRRVSKWHEENTTYITKYDGRGFSEGNLDITVSELLEVYLIEKEVKSLMSRNVVIFEKGKKGYYKYGKKKYNITASNIEAFKLKISKYHKDSICINDMQIDEAVAYYMTNMQIQ